MQRFRKWLWFSLLLAIEVWSVRCIAEAYLQRHHFDAIKRSAVDRMSRATIAARPELMESQLAAAQAKLEEMPDLFDVWIEVVDLSRDTIHQHAEGQGWKEGSEEQVAEMRVSLRSAHQALSKHHDPRPINLLFRVFLVSCFVCASTAILYFIFVGFKPQT